MSGQSSNWDASMCRNFWILNKADIHASSITLGRTKKPVLPFLKVLFLLYKFSIKFLYHHHGASGYLLQKSDHCTASKCHFPERAPLTLTSYDPSRLPFSHSGKFETFCFVTDGQSLCCRGLQYQSAQPLEVSNMLSEYIDYLPDIAACNEEFSLLLR